MIPDRILRPNAGRCELRWVAGRPHGNHRDQRPKPPELTRVGPHDPAPPTRRTSRVHPAASDPPAHAQRTRADLVRQEQEEIAIISGYLPKQMSEAEMAAAIEAAIKETSAAGMKDMGKVIGALRGKYAGQMDMAKASGMVKAKLQ